MFASETAITRRVSTRVFVCVFAYVDKTIGNFKSYIPALHYPTTPTSVNTTLTSGPSPAPDATFPSRILAPFVPDAFVMQAHHHHHHHININTPLLASIDIKRASTSTLLVHSLQIVSDVKASIRHLVRGTMVPWQCSTLEQ